MDATRPPRAGADSAARACVEMWRLYVAAIPGAWMEERDGVAGVVTGIPGTGFNGVWVERLDAAPETVARVLDRVAESKVPHCLQLRAGASPGLEELPLSRGMVLDGEEPTMVLEDTSALERALDAPGLAIERLGPRDGAIHARIAAAAFGARVEAFEAAATDAILSTPGIRCYAGRVDGEAVSTAVGVTHGGVTGLIAVATDAAHRRRGYGAAVTARAALDGFAAGAAWVWLQADPVAVGVYEGLGFRTVDRSAIWIAE
jgi:ribosomal protein S18 acetylase RimI-like enzyme